MNNYIEIQNELIAYAQTNLVDEKSRVDAVTFNGKEFIVFANTHASSWPQVTTYVGPGTKGFNELKEIIER